MSVYKNITIYSTTWCGDCLRTKMYLDDHKIPYENMDIEANPQYVDTVTKLNNGNQTVPTVVIDYIDGSQKVLSEPSNTELGLALEISE